jgi:hypothetical protein
MIDPKTPKVDISASQALAELLPHLRDSNCKLWQHDTGDEKGTKTLVSSAFNVSENTVTLKFSQYTNEGTAQTGTGKIVGDAEHHWQAEILLPGTIGSGVVRAQGIFQSVVGKVILASGNLTAKDIIEVIAWSLKAVSAAQIIQQAKPVAKGILLLEGVETIAELYSALGTRTKAGWKYEEPVEGGQKKEVKLEKLEDALSVVLSTDTLELNIHPDQERGKKSRHYHRILMKFSATADGWIVAAVWVKSAEKVPYLGDGDIIEPSIIIGVMLEALAVINSVQQA